MFVRFLTRLVFVSFLFVASVAHADRVVIIGDSHSGVLGPLLAQQYRQRGHTARIIQHNGWSARRYRSQGTLRRQIGRVDRAVVILGGNNRRRSEEDYREDINWVLSQLRRTGAAEVIWFGPLWCTALRVQERHFFTRNLQREIFVEQGVRWYDFYEVTREYELTRDGVHFTYSAYQQMVSSLFVPLLFP